MTTTLAFTPTLVAAPSPGPESLCALLSVYPAPGEPPVVETLADADPAGLIEALCDAVALRSPLPAPAVREVVENLVHADFRDAVVSVLDGGLTVRVSDHGPGIADPVRALQPGFTSAGPDARRVVRGVGGGLPLAEALMTAAGGVLRIDDNLGQGTAVTLAVPPPPAPAPPAAEPVCGEAARELLALLLEIGPAGAARLAAELGRGRAECGRELVLLQHRGLVAREPDGARRLTDAGAALVATLF
jgi:hypothetical protein